MKNDRIFIFKNEIRFISRSFPFLSPSANDGTYYAVTGNDAPGTVPVAVYNSTQFKYAGIEEVSPNLGEIATNDIIGNTALFSEIYSNNNYGIPQFCPVIAIYEGFATDTSNIISSRYGFAMCFCSSRYLPYCDKAVDTVRAWIIYPGYSILFFNSNNYGDEWAAAANEGKIPFIIRKRQLVNSQIVYANNTGWVNAANWDGVNFEIDSYKIFYGSLRSYQGRRSQSSLIELRIDMIS